MLHLMLFGASRLTIGGYQFLEILLLIFGLFLILAGAFTAYFGSGKSRSIGVGLLVGGLVVGIVSAYWYHVANVGANTLSSLLWFAFLVIVAAVIGALAAVAIFLVAIMKS